MSKVNVHIVDPSPRATHAVLLVLRDQLGLEVSWCDELEALKNAEGPKLIYGNALLPGSFHVAASGWLRSSGLAAFDPRIGQPNGMPVLFPTHEGDLPFDVFAASFYVLSRYEEWVGLPQDAHGRPLTASLHAARHGYLQRPIVDEWALLLASTWRERTPEFPIIQRSYEQVVTVDLDNGTKYLGRSWWRTLGSAARDLLNGRSDEVSDRLRVLRRQALDPFVIDQEVRAAFQRCAQRVLFFVLAAPRGKRDHAVPVDHPDYAPLLRALPEWAEVGVHPSYNSSVSEGMTDEEIPRVQSVTGIAVRCSRQHFLRLRIPSTLRELHALGIEEEFSLGLHDRLGFRCGTCTSYEWYDLEKECAMGLRIQPFAVMDNTLQIKLQLTPNAAVEQARAIIDAVKRVNGTFIGLWHESVLASRGPNVAWRRAILQIIEHAKP